MALIDNLVAYYKLDSNSNDSVSSYNGTDSNMSYSTTGKIGNGASFNGSSSKIDLPTASFNSALSTAVSISLWVKLAASTNNQYVFVLNSVGNDSPEIKIFIGTSGSDMTFNFTVYDSSAYQCSLTKTISYNTDWHHIVVIAANNDFRLYVDNVETSDNSGSFNIDSIGELSLGRYSRLGVYFNGMMDEIGFWDRGLTSSEVSKLYNAGAGLTYPFSVGSSKFFQLF